MTQNPRSGVSRPNDVDISGLISLNAIGGIQADAFYETTNEVRQIDQRARSALLRLLLKRPFT